MTTAHTPQFPDTGEIQLATFCLGDLLLGINIHQVQEINRNLEITPVPHAPEAVRGVANLRGEVVSIIDLGRVLGLAPAEITRLTRNVIVQDGGEQVGLLVDRIADVVSANVDEMDPLPENLGDLDADYFQGVFKLDDNLLVVLNVSRTLAAVSELTET